MKTNIKTLFWSSLAVKFLISLTIPLTLDEFYYFLWGHQLSLSYFDHPPMVGWVMALSQPLKGLAEGAIRWPFLLITHMTLLVWDQILKSQLSQGKRFWFLCIGLLNPLWGWGAFIATPDIPLVFFWSLSLYYVQRILFRETWKDYLGLAVALGLGFLSKYQIALFLPCLLLMLWQQSLWKRLFTIKALASVALALIVCSPVFLWNAQHDWVSFLFQWNHGMSFKYWKWTIPLEFILSQVAILFPPFLIFFFSKNQNWKSHWLLPFATFPFAFFLYSSFKGRVEANWVIMSVPCIYALSTLFTNERTWAYCRKSVSLWALLFLVALGTIPLQKIVPLDNIKLFEADKYQEILPELDDNKTYYAYSYQMASFLSFKKNRLICKLPGFGRPDHFQFLEECSNYGRGFSYITEKDDERDFSEQFPGLEKISRSELGQNFKLIEVAPR